MNRKTLSLLLWSVLTGALLSGGCTPNQLAKVMPMVEEKHYLSHQVRWQGETLIKISWWYTGSGNNWQHIASENPAINVKNIEIGDIIRIPEELVKTHEKMPKEYRVPTPAMKEKIPVARQIDRSTQLQLDLFGPVDTRPEEQEPETDSSLPLQTID